MKAESIVFAIAGMCFGVILGWVIGSQQGSGPAAVGQLTPAAGQAGTAATDSPRQPPPLDEARAKVLLTAVNGDPTNVQARVELGNVYFDAERFAEAIKWYEEALKLDPKDVNASTDLGVSYYYTGQPDRALQQFDYSLKLDARHVKTLLNQGIVLAFGKQDLKAAAESWKQVVAIAPDSPEGQTAKRALDGVANAHAGGATPGS
jgi:tetratricopeptide (TPR) repeat protein